MRPTHTRDSRDAFDNAIADGTLSDDPTHTMYAGHFMYMFTSDEGQDAFKHCETRDYVYTELPA